MMLGPGTLGSQISSGVMEALAGGSRTPIPGLDRPQQFGLHSADLTKLVKFVLLLPSWFSFS